MVWREPRPADRPGDVAGGRRDAEEGLRLPEVEVVRTPRATRALLAGVTVEARDAPPLAALRRECDLLVVATGAWASPHLAELGIALRSRPGAAR